MGTRIQFVCQRWACRLQVEIELPTGSGVGFGLEIPRICGSKMKKSTRSVSLRNSLRPKAFCVSAIVFC